MSQIRIDISKKLIRVLLLTLGLLIGLFLCYKSFFYLAPFIIAFVISFLIEPYVQFLIKKARVSRKVASALSVLTVIIAIGGILSFLITKLIAEAVDVYNSLPQYNNTIYNNISALIKRLNQINLMLPDEINFDFSSFVPNITTFLIGNLNFILKKMLDTAISIPDVVVFILVTILSTYFLTSDKDKIYNFITKQIPNEFLMKVQLVKRDMFSALMGYIRAQLIMMTLTFSELSIGLTVVGIKSPILLALAISLVDALPILGTGSILVPWAIYNFIIGNIKVGLSLLCLYAIALIVRQLVEPKVLSKQIGIHPLVTLFAMYIGLKLFGILGLIMGPITVLLLKNIISNTLKEKPFSEYLSHHNTHLKGS